MTDTAAKTEAEKAAEAKAAADKKAADEKAAEAKDTKASRRNLAPAGQSGDPVVQKLLAERMGHDLSVQPDPSLAAQRENAVKAIADIDEKLAELGFTAK